ncbi:MAG: DEAD/DEAH box helicase, partial [Candidatus Nanopelagicales bacterium]
MNFVELGVKPEICNALARIGITDAFQIQELTLPLGLAGKDIIGQAKTGTGKTLGFGIPLLQAMISPASAEYAQL